MPLGRRALLAAGAALPLAARPARAARLSTLDMPPLRISLKLDDTVAPGYRRSVLVRWGDRVTYDALPWNPLQPTPVAAATQFGWDARICGMVVPPVGADGIARAVLAVAHPTVDPAMAFPGGQDRPAVAAMMQGASLLNIEKQGGRWIVVDGGYQSRRLTAETLCRISGPAAGVAGGLVQGLLAVSGGCATPWGTQLLAEGDPAPWMARLGALDPRFTQGLRFGWVAELDPMDPAAVPSKRTALARFPRGDAAAALTRDGRAVVYLSDRRVFGHLFRFVSDGPAGAPDALDLGTLSVARYAGGRLRWEPLPRTVDMLLNPIAYAGRVGAIGFDVPSGLAVDPHSGMLYLACNGNAARRRDQVDPLNPRAGSRSGHVVEIIPAGGDHGADEAAANVLLLGGAPPQRFGGLAGSWPDAPATLTVDGAGRLWIGTDHAGRIGPEPDMLFGCDTSGPGRGLALPLYGAPRGAGIGAAAMSPDGLTLFSVARTPGAEPGASYARPGTRWPAFDPNLPPRTTLVAFSSASGVPIGG
ncbi:MAG TPA: alkaline phosphatase PhoX [Roseomonas sp.]|nr:alkaline phosphatase PhoX [Roseomonas sp.]